jgi:Mrp family chromosome partitioning ATPase
MGRIFDILKRGGSGKAADAPPRPRPYQPESSEVKDASPTANGNTAGPEENEEIPYIEVGGPRQTIDASPSVLAATVKRLKKIDPPQLESKNARSEARSRPVEGNDQRIQVQELKAECDQPQPRIEPARTEKLSPPRMADEPRLVMTPLPLLAEPSLVAVAFRPLHTPPPPLPPARERFAPELVAFHQSQHPVSQQYRALLGSLLTAHKSGQTTGAEALFFTGAAPGVGTTTTVLNLAITAAREARPNDAGDAERRVLVIDACTRRAAVAHKLGLPASPGLHEVLAGSIPVEQAVRESGQANLHVLTAGTADADRGNHLVGEAMETVVRQLRGRFQLILVDGMPWDGRPDVVAPGALCDGVYLVVRHDDHQKPEVAELLHVIPRQGSRLRGCVLTYR